MRVSPIETPGINGANVLRIVRRAPVRLKSRSETLCKEKTRSSWHRETVFSRKRRLEPETRWHLFFRPHTVVTRMTTSRLVAVPSRGSLGRSWLRMWRMVYPQWWLRIVLNLRTRWPPLLPLARPCVLLREPRFPALLLELNGSPKSFAFS